MIDDTNLLHNNFNLFVISHPYFQETDCNASLGLCLNSSSCFKGLMIPTGIKINQLSNDKEYTKIQLSNQLRYD